MNYNNVNSVFIFNFIIKKKSPWGTTLTPFLDCHHSLCAFSTVFASSSLLLMLFGLLLQYVLAYSLLRVVL